MQPLPPPTFPWVDNKDGKAKQAFAQYMTQNDLLLRSVMITAANDAAAKAAGVPVGGLYNNSGAVRIRLV